MTDAKSYAVFLFPQALEALGEAVQPYLSDAPAGRHFVCASIDASGAYFEMTLQGADAKGQPAELELRIPHAMVRLIMSLHDDHPFGFQARTD
ncbi:MAG: hypothetical protein JSS28_01340 [Proteobacteria bacterium]|nr:hypothetical protein [Pseudomonadota bacterium]